MSGKRAAESLAGYLLLTCAYQPIGGWGVLNLRHEIESHFEANKYLLYSSTGIDTVFRSYTVIKSSHSKIHNVCNYLCLTKDQRAIMSGSRE